MSEDQIKSAAQDDLNRVAAAAKQTNAATWLSKQDPKILLAVAVGVGWFLGQRSRDKLGL